MKNLLAVLSLFCAIAVQADAVSAKGSAATSRPNVILILTDDQGYGDVSAHGNPVLKTPNVDKLRSQAVSFTDFHVAPMCSPTRGQLLTGIDAMRNGCTAVCQGRSMMRAELPTMADFFAGSGYATGHFGKWHLGDSYPHRPQDRGFQETVHHRAWGITSLADHWENHTDVYFDPILSHNGTDKKYQGYCTDIFFSEAMKWIDSIQAKNKEQGTNNPFFLYLPTNTPHVPNVCPDKYSDPYRGEHEGKNIPAEFYGMIANIDENLGRLEAFLKDKGLRDNTILIYMADNGTQSRGAQEIYNAGMRARKTSVYEGGHRVPLFIRWNNGELKHGLVDELTEVQDLLPTLVELCGLKNESNTKFDGLSLAGLLTGSKAELPDRKIVAQYRVSGEPWDPAVVMWDKWRLLREKKGRKKNNQPLELYHVGRDPGQKRNVADKFPEIVETMKKHYEEWHAEAKPLFDRERWITIGSKEANPMVLYAQDWVGDYCDNPGGLAAATAHGYWNVDVDRAGVYELELRRWPKESNKELREGWADGPGGLARSRRPIVAANLRIAGKNYTLDTKPQTRHATFRVRLPAGKTELSTLFLNADDRSLGSAIYVYLRRLDNGANAKLTPVSNRKSKGRVLPGQGAPRKKTATKSRPDDILIADFEASDYGDWRTTGEAFGKAPAKGSLRRQMKVSGFIGKGLVNSFVGGDNSTGTLTSPPFIIKRPYLNFLVGGGRWDTTCMNLLIDGKVVKKVSGSNPGGNRTELLEPATWDVKAFVGKTAIIQIIDQRKGGWGHISVDHITQSKEAAVKPVVLVKLEKKLKVTDSHLVVPVANKGKRFTLGIYEGERLVQNFNVVLPPANATTWLAAYPLAQFDLAGNDIRIAPVDGGAHPQGFKSAFDRIRIGSAAEAQGLGDYRHAYRDQFHPTTRRGWNNDPNGMVYHDGKYHLYYQRNPFGITWGNMHWGHLISKDLIHWKEEPIALFQKTTGDMMFSGGGFVDFNNSAGLGKNTLFVAFTSTGRGECLAYSQDGGMTFKEIEENPVVKHKGRDPKIIWYELEKKWVMAVFDDGPCAETKALPPSADFGNRNPANIAFYESKNLRQWKRTGAFTDPDRRSVWECPELFELPVDGQPGAKRWVLYGAQNRYFIGKFDGKKFIKESGPHGIAYDQPGVRPLGGRGAMYAAQTFSDMPDGRRIQIGWVRTAQYLDKFPGQIYSQSFSFPQELTLRQTDRGVRMFYQPVAEAEQLRARVLTESADGLNQAMNELSEVFIEFEEHADHQLTINGIDASFKGRRARIFTDRNFNEIYIDDGREYRATLREPGKVDSRQTAVTSDSPIKSLKIYRLKSIWPSAGSPVKR